MAAIDSVAQLWRRSWRAWCHGGDPEARERSWLADAHSKRRSAGCDCTSFDWSHIAFRLALACKSETILADGQLWRVLGARLIAQPGSPAPTPHPASRIDRTMQGSGSGSGIAVCSPSALLRFCAECPSAWSWHDSEASKADFTAALAFTARASTAGICDSSATRTASPGSLPTLVRQGSRSNVGTPLEQL